MEHESVGLSDEQLARIVAAYSAEPAEGEPPELGAVGGDPELTNLEGFSEADWSAITEFCGRVSDVVAAPEWRTASVFHRFLVARKGDADKAEAMYRAAMEWRREGRIDSLLWRYSEPAAMRQFFASGVIGADTAGFPVLIERTGAVDLAALGAAMGADAFLDWVAWYHERQERVMRVASAMASEVLGRPVLRHKMTVIVDLNGIGRGHLNSATLGVLQRRTGESAPRAWRRPAFATPLARGRRLHTCCPPATAPGPPSIPPIPPQAWRSQTTLRSSAASSSCAPPPSSA